MTVGPGIAPDLLTPDNHQKDGTGALAGSRRSPRAYRRWGISPRPESVFKVF
jgi:threonine aldolase